MDKKNYTKPVLDTKTIALGVFGDYSHPGGGDDGNGGVVPLPFKGITDRELHMD